MKVFRITVQVSFAILLSSCGSAEMNRSELYGWQNMAPPRSSVLGREVLDNGFIGEQIFKADGDATEEALSINQLKIEERNQLAAGAEFTMKEVSAEIGASYENSVVNNSNEWTIKSLKNITNSIDVNRRFVYQCIAAKSSTFQIQSKISGGVKIDAAKSIIAKKLNIEKAKIFIESKPEKPNFFEVKIDNPDVCISYKTAIFKDDGSYYLGTKNIANNYVTITGNGAASLAKFNLEDGQESNFRTAQFIGIEPPYKPMYRLLAKRNNETNRLTLSVCRQGQGLKGFDYACKIIEDGGTGKWNHLYHIDTFSYVNGKYKVVLLSIDAHLQGDTIVIDSASLRYPQYSLKIS